MNLLGRIAMLFKRRTPDPDTMIARELAHRISVRADELTKQFQIYQRSRDPFAAMMADIYNRDQLSRLHRGLSK
jgi:hypothetical protein